MQNITLAPINVRKMKKKEAEERAMQLLERVGIPERRRRNIPASYPAANSSDVAIARALAMQPKIMSSTSRPRRLTRR